MREAIQFHKTAKPHVSSLSKIAARRRVYFDSITGGDCHHRDSAGAVVARLEQGKRKGK
jgi:hypothetical protein